MTTAAVCVALQVVLTGLVIRQRLRTGISLLDGGDIRLTRRIRAHGNLTETAPVALLLLGLLELAGLGRGWLLTAAGLLVVGRCLHALGVLGPGDGLARRVGMLATLCALSLLAAAALWMAARGS